MSHDRIELQSYFSENSSLSSNHAHQTNGTPPNLTTSTTNMSGTGSFGTGSSAPIPIVQHTDADPTQNPTYSSIPDAHHQYRAAHAHLGQEHSPPHQAPPTSTTGHTPLLDNGETQYELIPGETKHGKAPTPLAAGVTMQADNVLYGDAETAQDLRHKTLTEEDYRHHYKGSISPQPHELLKEEEESGGGALRRCLVVGIAFVLLTLLIAALAAGVLSLAILFTGFIDTDICDCPAESPTGGSTLSQIDDRIVMLEARVEDLMARLEAATATPSTGGATPSSEETTPPVITMTPEPLPEEMERNVTLSALNLFQDCTTSIEVSCTIGTGSSSNDVLSCVTDPVTINRPGEYVLSVQCLIVQETTEPNPLITTLDIDANLGLCRCYVPTLNTVNQVVQPVTCGMQITRCTIPSNITARIL